MSSFILTAKPQWKRAVCVCFLSACSVQLMRADRTPKNPLKCQHEVTFERILIPHIPQPHSRLRSLRNSPLGVQQPNPDGIKPITPFKDHMLYPRPALT